MQRGTSESGVIGMFYLRRREGCTDVMKYGEFEPLVYDRSNIVHGMIDSNELVTEKSES